MIGQRAFALTDQGEELDHFGLTIAALVARADVDRVMAANAHLPFESRPDQHPTERNTMHHQRPLFSQNAHGDVWQELDLFDQDALAAAGDKNVTAAPFVEEHRAHVAENAAFDLDDDYVRDNDYDDDFDQYDFDMSQGLAYEGEGD